MGTTGKGLPYPEPTDPIAAGADAIKALAQAVNQPVSGRVTVSLSNAAQGNTTVTFPAGHFTAAPRVSVTPSGTGAGVYYGTTGVPSTASVTVIANHRDATPATISIALDWVAVA
jgi:hypothetical protein